LASTPNVARLLNCWFGWLPGVAEELVYQDLCEYYALLYGTQKARVDGDMKYLHEHYIATRGELNANAEQYVLNKNKPIKVKR